MSYKKQNNIVIIGGTACGPKAAARARRCDPQAEITIIEQEKDLSTATCGLPYYISGVIASRRALVARKHDFFMGCIWVVLGYITYLSKRGTEPESVPLSL